MLENPERSGTERNGTERNRNQKQLMHNTDARTHWTRGQKLALIRTVCVCVRTRILRSVTAMKTGQAPAESHAKRMTC